MAKLVVVLLVYFLASTLTSCSASRPLGTLTAFSSDKSDPTTAISKSVFSSASAPPATESGVISVDVEDARTESELEESLNDVAPPCMEEDLEDSSVDGGKPCHRSLIDSTYFGMLDYRDSGTGKANPNPHGR